MNNIVESFQVFALGAFRHSLDWFCDVLNVLDIPSTEIAEILGSQASAILHEDEPTISLIFANAADFLPMPRDIAPKE